MLSACSALPQHRFADDDLITTEGMPQHTGNANTLQRLKLAADWELLSRVLVVSTHWVSSI
jgi:hypothetical protein